MQFPQKSAKEAKQIIGESKIQKKNDDKSEKSTPTQKNLQDNFDTLLNNSYTENEEVEEALIGEIDDCYLIFFSFKKVIDDKKEKKTKQMVKKEKDKKEEDKKNMKKTLKIKI